MNIYTIAAVKSDTTVITGINDQQFSPELEQIILAGSGQVDPGFVAVGRLRPSLAFTTTAIKVALAGLGGIAGKVIASDFYFWFQKIAEGGLRAGALSHVMATVVKGLIIPQTLNMPDGQAATISYLVIMISADGSAAPVAFAGSQSLDAGQAGAVAGWILGATSINGTDLDAVDNVAINFGLTPVIEGGSGLVYPTFVGIQSRKPSITISCKDVDAFVTWDLDGVIQSETDSTIQLDDLAEGGMRGSSPIIFGIDEGMIHTTQVGASSPQSAVNAVTITPTDDGTADIIAISGLS